jgi:hypothetical protein
MFTHGVEQVLLCVICAIGVGNLLSPSIYDSLLELNGLPYFYNLPSDSAASAGARWWSSAEVRGTVRRPQGWGQMAGGLQLPTAKQLMRSLETLCAEGGVLPLQPSPEQLSAVRRPRPEPWVAVVEGLGAAAGGGGGGGRGPLSLSGGGGGGGGGLLPAGGLVLVGVVRREALGRVVATASAVTSPRRNGEGGDAAALDAAESGGESNPLLPESTLQSIVADGPWWTVDEATSLPQLQNFFARLGIEQAWVLRRGRLVGMLVAEDVALPPWRHAAAAAAQPSAKIIHRQTSSSGGGGGGDSRSGAAASADKCP